MINILKQLRKFYFNN